MAGPKPKRCRAESCGIPCRLEHQHAGHHLGGEGLYAWPQAPDAPSVDEGADAAFALPKVEPAGIEPLKASMGYARKAYRELLIRDARSLQLKGGGSVRRRWDETLDHYAALEVQAALRQALGDVEGALAYDAWAKSSGLAGLGGGA